MPEVFSQAHLSHGFFHQSTAALQKQFQFTHEQAQRIVQACAGCQQAAPLPALGVNLRGCQGLEIWQTDITHITEFGKLKYINVTINTFSTHIFASAHRGKCAKMSSIIFCPQLQPLEYLSS